MMRRSSPLLLATWLSAGALSGCSALLDPENCAADTDCAEGLACVDGVCLGQAAPQGDAGATADARLDAPDGGGGAGGDVGGAGGAVQPGEGPELTVIAPVMEAQIAQGEVNFLGLVEGPRPVRSIQLTRLGAEPVEATLDAETGAWSGQLTLPGPGTYDVDVIATDEAGGQSLDWRRITWDDTEPAVAFSTPAPSTCLQGRPARLCVTASDPGGLDGGAVTIAGVIAEADPEVEGGYCATANLPEGDQRLTAEVRDAAGHVATATLDLQVDQRPPQIALSGLTGGALVGALGGERTVTGQVTDDGCGVDLSGLTLIQGETTLAFDLQADGRFTAPLTLAAGAQTLRWQAADLAGNVGRLEIEVVADVAAPIITLQAPAPEITLVADAEVEIQATVTDDASLDGLTVTLNGATVEGAVTEGGLLIEAVGALQAGRNTFTLRATDAAGLTAAHTFELRSDPTPPTVTIEDVTVVGGDSYTLTVTGAADDGPEGSGVAEVTLNGQVATLDPDSGAWRLEGLQAASGPIHLEARATDALGNTSAPWVLDLERDLTPPVIELTDLALGLDACTRDSTINLCAQIRDPENEVVEVLIDGEPEPLSAQGTFCTPLVLSPGLNAIEITARNAVDLVSALDLEIIRDQTAPQVVFDLPEGGYVDGASGVATLSGHVIDAGCGISTRRITLADQPVALDDEDRFSVELLVGDGALEEGPNFITWRVTDGAGNPASGTVPVVVDTDPPEIRLQSPEAASSALLNADQLDLNVLLVDEWSGVASATLDGAPLELQPVIGVVGGVRIRALVAVQPGPNIFELVATDQLGLTQRQTIEVEVYLDDTPPTITFERPAAQSCVNEQPILICAQVQEDVTPLGALALDGGPLDLDILDAEGRFCVVPLLGEGPAAVTLEAENIGGARSQQSLIFTTDFTPPAVTFLSPAERTPLDGSLGLPFQGQISDDGCGLAEQPMLLFVPDAPAPLSVEVGPDGAFDLDVTLAREGPQLLGWEALDVAGNVSSGQLELWVDRGPPEINLQSPALEAFTTDVPLLTLRFEVLDAATTALETITLNGALLPLPPSAELGRAEVEIPLELPLGESVYEITATDALGFTARRELHITYDPDPGALAPRVSFQGPVPLEGLESADLLFDALAVSPDRLHVAAAYKDPANDGLGLGRLGLWRRQTGELIWRSEVPLWTEGCAFHPEGSWIVCAHTNYPDLQSFSLKTFDPADGSLLGQTAVQIPLGSTPAPQLYDGYAAAISPDGVWGAAAAGGPDGSQVMIFAFTAAGRPVLDSTFELLGGAVDEVAFSRDGSTLYATDFLGAAIHSFELEGVTWRRASSLQTPDSVAGLDVDGEGRVIASGYFGRAIYIVTPDVTDFSQSDLQIVAVSGKSYDLCADPRPGAHWAWAVSQDAGETQAIDTATGAILATDQITPRHADGLSYSCDPLTGQPFAVSVGNLWTWTP